MSRPWTWNGQALKTPSEYSWTFSDLSSEATGRATLDGTAYKDIVAQKRSLDVTWWSLFDTNINGKMTIGELLIWIKAETFGVLSYPDPVSGTNISKTFYTGDVTATMYQVRNNVAEYKCKISFIEQ